MTIHSFCLRVPIARLLSGKNFNLSLPVISLLLLSVIAFILGPLFCGKLCPAGAVTEYLSALTPKKYKIQWSEHIPVLQIRYGFFLGFILSFLFGGHLACVYCNFYVFDLFANFISVGRITALTTSLLLTLILWIVVLGIFTKGGRGYCVFFCPVGTFQNLLYVCGNKILPWRGALLIRKKECNSCNICVTNCPMNAIKLDGERIAEKNTHLCILCMTCVNKCPKNAIRYFVGRSGVEENDQKF